ncbi:MAG: ribosome small subunit-dependent GTPase A [Bacteroidetes bacterium]|nr:ribosome small subunit-dependent GTPase A [Bacteroidota bacterium]
MEKGLVIKCVGSSYRVKRINGEKITCMIRGKLRMKGVKTTNPVTVGDFVDIEIVDGGKNGIIRSVHDRRNYIIRKSTNLSRQHHVIAANIDQAFLMATLAYPETTPTFIDRFLATAEAYRIPVIILFNKMDMYSDSMLEYLDHLTGIYKTIGYECISTSAVTGENTETVRNLMKGKISLVSGHSGVGKSLLINVIEPGLDLKIKEISSYHLKGKHTTTFSEMFELSCGGYIIDTPGIKAFGLTDMYKEEIYHFFPEMFRLSSECRFYNCTHLHEPGCAVKKGVEDGKISESRYISYLGMMEEDSKYR